jgi:hypothetical protein
MKFLATLTLALLGLTPMTTASAAGPCVEVEEEPLPIGRVTALHKAGASLLKGLACDGNQRCLKNRGEFLERAAYTVVDVCLAEPHVPKWMCLGFVANLGNESGGLEHPTCGGLPQKCVKECDKLDAGAGRQGCFLDCARDKGISYGGARWKRVERCNDWGTSRGPFQQKKGSIAYCKKVLKNPSYNPHSLVQSARCVIKKVKKHALARRFPCRKSDGNRWMIAMLRVGRGPLKTVEKASKKRWVPGARLGDGKWVAAKKAVRVQRCEESRYARWGMSRYRQCGKACQKIQRPTSDQLSPATPRVHGNKTVGMKDD